MSFDLLSSISISFDALVVVVFFSFGLFSSFLFASPSSAYRPCPLSCWQLGCFFSSFVTVVIFFLSFFRFFVICCLCVSVFFFLLHLLVFVYVVVFFVSIIYLHFSSHATAISRRLEKKRQKSVSVPLHLQIIVAPSLPPALAAPRTRVFVRLVSTCFVVILYLKKKSKLLTHAKPPTKKNPLPETLHDRFGELWREAKPSNGALRCSLHA